MKMFDINNQVVNVDVRPSQYPIRAKSKSLIQQTVGKILVEHFPFETILEEFTVPGSKLSVDFFLPKRGMVVEVQGQQHNEHIPFFHGDKNSAMKYPKQKHNDAQKALWCNINDFQLIEIDHGASIDDIKNSIME